MGTGVLYRPDTEPAPAESDHKKSEGRLPVIEIFGPTIQGEGAMIGVKTHFIRFGGCDYRCRMCDSMHAVLPAAVKKNATWALPEDILDSVYQLDNGKTKWITLSGGNPCMWDLGILIDMLHRHGFSIALETQGSIWADWVLKCDLVTVCPKGPGMGEKFDLPAFSTFIKEATWYVGRTNIAVKAVIFDQRDFEWAAELDHYMTEKLRLPLNIRYLSLGNPYPPPLKSDMTLDEDAWARKRAEQNLLRPGDTLAQVLLETYKSLLEDFLQHQRLTHWKFLPQLHVLVYGNETGV